MQKNIDSQMIKELSKISDGNYVLEMLDRYNLQGTIYCTHEQIERFYNEKKGIKK